MIENTSIVLMSGAVARPLVNRGKMENSENRNNRTSNKSRHTKCTDSSEQLFNKCAQRKKFSLQQIWNAGERSEK